jgi:DNA-binding NarL/FixJ family response regulator
VCETDDVLSKRGDYGKAQRRLETALESAPVTGDVVVEALLAQGQSAKTIASTLFISPWTVQDHIEAIYRKTGVGARSDLTSLATGNGPN